MKEVLTTQVKEYPLFSRGKVRDVYDLGDRLLIVATDRLSAFDVVLPNGIPGRGVMLTAVSVFWFNFLKDIVPSHLIAADIDQFPADLHKYRDDLEGRSMIVHKAKRVDVECIVRGYISGSLWKEYKTAVAAGTSVVHGMTFPSDLKESDRLPEPIFTPSTKAESGHDENISFDRMVALVGEETARLCRDTTLAIYAKASDYALNRGIIIADTKFEFGYVEGRFTLIDEALSPDSSRFWPVDSYRQGQSQPSFDKQIIRDYLETLDWDKTYPAPVLPKDVVQKASEKYQEVVARLTR
ncbi:MAG: phosphoribosylaminoimidazolesuccinocarboxamide synthase [candidate division Zixibacteria bacterium]|nr:phosphoribosylaminoimidazolesuccinocarboxamide synthase [candidate division Zixibacteria bacterium]